MALFFRCSIRTLATNRCLPHLSLLHLFNDIAERKRKNEMVHEKFYEVEANQLISPANYSGHAGDVEWVQHLASVDERNCLEPDVAK